MVAAEQLALALEVVGEVSLGGVGKCLGASCCAEIGLAVAQVHVPRDSQNEKRLPRGLWALWASCLRDRCDLECASECAC